MPSYSIGVDLGGTNLRIAALDEQGNVLEKITRPARNPLGRDAVLDDMCRAIGELSGKFAGQLSLQGVGIGVPGIVDLHTGMLRKSPNLPGWEDYPVKKEIENRLGSRVILENDANAAALGEQRLGAALDVEDMAMITLGTGVGSAFIFGGKIWHGMNGMAGEVGHMTLEPDGRLCKCGNRGCLEEYASATAIMRMARETMHGDFSAEDVHRLARQGNDAACHIFVEVGRALGIAIASLVNALNLPMYVIGGGVSAAWDAFSPAIFEELPKRSMVYAATAPGRVKAGGRITVVTRAQLGSDAGLYGAARLPYMGAR